MKFFLFAFVLVVVVVVVVDGLPVSSGVDNKQQQHNEKEEEKRNNPLPCYGHWKFDISKERCEERGCLWDPTLTSDAWCHYPNSERQKLTRIHVVQGSHVDVGFSNTAENIVNTWLTEHVPKAMETGEQLEKKGGNEQLRYTTQSWFVSYLFDCLAHPEGVNCPGEEERVKFVEAAQKGWITWHAFPFNSELEVYDAETLIAGVQLTHWLDDVMNVSRKTVLSQRDVPSTSRGAIPVLRSQGVDTISIGSNGGSTPPNVPPLFRWKDAESGEEVRVLYNWGGYGGVAVLGIHIAIPIPGSTEAVAFYWRGDNSGPPSADELVAAYEAITKSFPGVELVSSSLEQVAARIRTVPDEMLPLITTEFGDTWIHGIASDPVKLRKLLTMQDLTAECIHQGACNTSDPRIRHFQRLLLKNGEHTWGSDQKVVLGIPEVRANWSNTEFEAARASVGSFQELESSWVHQRLWGIDNAIAALQDHPLAATIATSFAAQDSPSLPVLTGYTQTQDLQYQCGRFHVTIDKTTGAICDLVDLRSGSQWQGQLGQYRYRTYSSLEFTTFMAEYNFMGPLFYFDDLDDFDKVGLGSAAHARTATATASQMWAKHNSSQCSFRIQLSLDERLHVDAGAPEVAWLSMEVGEEAIDFKITMFNKTSTRLPEAAFLSFELDSKDSLQPMMNKISSHIDPRDIQLGGNRRMHMVGREGVVFADKSNGSSMQLTSTDTRLICWGAPTAFPTPLADSPDTNKVSFNLWNNIWNTNYIMWFPYLDNERTQQFNFKMAIA